MKLLCVPERNSTDVFFTYVVFEFTQMSLVLRERAGNYCFLNFLFQTFSYVSVFLFKLILIGGIICKEQHVFLLQVF